MSVITFVVCLLGGVAWVRAGGNEPRPYVEDPTWDEHDHDCALSSFSLYPYVVKIFVVAENEVHNHGSLISYKGVLTTCEKLDVDNPTKYFVLGQKFKNMKNLTGHCTQTRFAKEITVHPQCRGDNITYFNFAIFELSTPFRIENSYTVPTMPYVLSPIWLLQNIRYVDVVRDNKCEIPQFLRRYSYSPTFQANMRTESIEFRSECIYDWLCQSLLGESRTKCASTYRNTMNGTFLCIRPLWSNSLVFPEEEVKIPEWITGIPLVCNNTVYGITTKRVRAQYDGNVDIFLVTTLLRIWYWFIESREKLSAPWINKTFVTEDELKFEPYNRAPKQPIPEKQKPFERSSTNDKPLHFSIACSFFMFLAIFW